MKLTENKWKLIGIISFSILIGTFLSPIIFHGSNTNNPTTLTAESKNPTAKNNAIAMENAFYEVFETVSPSVVSIATEKTVNVQTHPFMNDPFFDHFFGGGGGNKVKKQKQSGLGSGIILSADGYILTNEHVIRDMDKLTVKLKNGKTYTAKIIGSDKTMDLALLKISPKEDLKPVALGDSSKVKVGNWAIAIGAPLGFEQSFTVGVVSAVSRGGIDASGLFYIQSDAAINQGNSGGPLLNINGEVIGINRMIASQSGGSVGIGFTIPINEAKKVVDELKSSGKVKRAWLGIGLDIISDEEKEELKLSSKKGALVKQVVNGSPADKSGIQLMDVITKIGSKEISNPEDVINTVRDSKIGKKLTMEIVRNGETVKTAITPSEKPN